MNKINYKRRNLIERLNEEILYLNLNLKEFEILENFIKYHKLDIIDKEIKLNKGTF